MSGNQPESYKTTCSYCGVGCGIVVNKDHKGNISVQGDPDHPVNKGKLCSKGLNLKYVVEDQSDRLLYPEMKWSKAHPFKRVSWDTAMERAAAAFTSIQKKYGPDSVGFYVSGQCLTEGYYLANKLVKGFLGTNNIDTNSRLCMSSAVAAYKKMLGEDAVPICYDDIEQADCFFITGANPAWCHPILFRRIEQHKAENPNVKIIVADPRKTQSCELADLHLPLNPGTDIYLCNAIARVLIERGDINPEFIENHVDGFDEYRKSVFKYSVEESAQICGLETDQILQAASWIGDAEGFITMWAMGLNQSAIGVKKNFALISLNLITGQIGKPGAGPFSLTGQPNAMGGREVGGMASLLAAHKDLSNPQHRQEVADFWDVPGIQEKPGYTATEMFDALDEGKLKAVWIIATNPMVSLPDVNKAERALKKASFVVVQDISRKSDTLEYADLILPAAGHMEKEGTMTNSERRIGHLQKIVDPPGEALPDSEILMRFAKAMGFHGFDFETTGEIFEEYSRLTAGTNINISGLKYEHLQAQNTVQWPLNNLHSSGQKRLFTDHTFYTDNGKAQLFPLDSPANTSKKPTDKFPLVLTTGRIRDQWHTMTKTGKVSKLKQHISKPFLQIHPKDAANRNIKDGENIRILNSRGEVKVHARVTEDVRKGLVFLPMHWGKLNGKSTARANNLTRNLIDPISKEPDFKYSTVQVEKITKEKEKIIVIGAGASSYRFVNTYRELNQTDEIHVFSNEPTPFYNRVLLPEYVTEHLSWEDLLKFKKNEIDKLNIHLYDSTSVTSIDRGNKTITDDSGQIHSYDKLIAGTGSRAFVPPNEPVDEPGVFTMRTRADADALKKYVNNGAHVLIIGGGLLGLELAAALTEIDIDITIVQLASRLMERQLDALSAELLMEFVEQKGITVHVNDQVKQIHTQAHPEYIPEEGIGAILKSGKKLHCDAVVFAIGTRPNIEILKEAGVDCGRGVLVDDTLQTSDPSIFAMGEIAEHRGKLNGITAAAEQQADIVAKNLAGDSLALYDGSISMNILKFSDLDLCSIGLPVVPSGEKGYEEILFIDKSQQYYKKCIIKDDRLVGAILMGDKDEFAEFKSLIESKMELSDLRKQLLRSGKSRDPVIGKTVCSCNHVGRGNIEKLIENGCEDFNDLCEKSGAGLGCGSCKPEVQQILNEKFVLA
ncbi:NAD(P)H-nitrite reductase [Rhodohalobacter sp. SW132]|uniref:nitrate reductase n=1 Tax=Rhodohalobacter sp. SW132 TaxID=2293433 RepID=UPI000E25C674|nr:nitrate reductase [Rhodohalobacter sp. SW132]REL29182.1 NAD(P)H-nitrite reductase [Rhodohalobacter sp. SW132]